MNNIAIRSNEVSKLSSQLDFILLDGSGSMMDKWWPMLEAIDTFVAGLKASAVDTHILMHIFDDSALQLVGRNTHIRDYKTFAAEPVGSNFGLTPLYDAIVMMGATIRDLNPSKASILIVTDGENTEHANKFGSLAQAHAVLDWLRAHGYQVTFMGCDFNNERQAKALGANASNTIGVQTKLLTDAAKSFAKKRAAHAHGDTPISFTEDERQQFGGYLAHNNGA